MVSRAVLQMAKAASQNKEILGYNRECCQDTDKCCNNHVLFGSYCPTWYETESFDLWGLADSKHFFDGQNSP